jgi:hypothetical protein
MKKIPIRIISAPRTLESVPL